VSDIVLSWLADGTPATITIDGVTYRVARVDGSGRQLVTLDQDDDTVTWANEAYATAQTNNELVAAPGAALVLYLAVVIFSTKVAGSFSLTQSSGLPATVLGPHYFAANSGLALAPVSPPLSLNANSALRITTDITGDHSISVATKTV
jgi:hypothetical protein